MKIKTRMRERVAPRLGLFLLAIGRGAALLLLLRMLPRRNALAYDACSSLVENLLLPDLDSLFGPDSSIGHAIEARSLHPKVRVHATIGAPLLRASDHLEFHSFNKGGQSNHEPFFHTFVCWGGNRSGDLNIRIGMALPCNIAQWGNWRLRIERQHELIARHERDGYAAFGVILGRAQSISLRRCIVRGGGAGCHIAWCRPY